MGQAYAEMWFSCGWNPASCSAPQLMQVGTLLQSPLSHCANYPLFHQSLYEKSFRILIVLSYFRTVCKGAKNIIYFSCLHYPFISIWFQSSVGEQNKLVTTFVQPSYYLSINTHLFQVANNSHCSAYFRRRKEPYSCTISIYENVTWQ